MNPDLTDLTLVVDRSGSMETVRRGCRRRCERVHQGADEGTWRRVC